MQTLKLSAVTALCAASLAAQTATHPLGNTVIVRPLGGFASPHKKSPHSQQSTSYFGLTFFVPPDLPPAEAPPVPVVPEPAPAAEAPVVQAPEPAEQDLPKPGDLLAEPATYYLIAYKDHSMYAALTYWLEGDTLHYVTTQNTHNQASLALIDLDKSYQLNAARSVPFSIPNK